MHKSLILALMMSAPGPAFAQAGATPPATETQTPAAPAQAAPSPAQAEKLRCKSTNSVGSRTRKARICLTESEWRRQAEIARTDTRALQERTVAPRGQ